MFFISLRPLLIWCCQGVKPFPLHKLPQHQAYLCPVRALADWLVCLRASGINEGYIFPRMNSGDRISHDNRPMPSEAFLELFRNNLVDVGIDPWPYGTHSFRRGGTQWLAYDKRWPIRQICKWGGWSTDPAGTTVMKYLDSWNDDSAERREDYFDPNRLPTSRCHQCGRSCHCA
ncbi:hypothetical protein PILCRDRAFT_81411 [Piloderma croceum F 1598]|uniref:Tyr recombinase domain-containing protein n=1 Tax=Piloderma croceum (strain F 1598) TaxID=765440 RepID=A0A0C3EYN6_PILCF|nr:hypothetical protein PILCRDRAFT_81411 [Piloderma croceum F 1598]